ncbi:MAG: LacI family DNA-binding transcriptional regulator [Tessaracoccus sp.]|uniref:LacI family DNA-binding transcriptional regulator n=1 Tax=Tessaracoccus sp. TaxID=1971211 RepID=UPI001EC4DB13|nr:LacI family DNA-binding transcriptional regulator [Tessaracoccus sp.]MBK7820532.1 LacI family DNA-binding transcriptional regulator [Tessaracoccus sp.]
MPTERTARSTRLDVARLAGVSPAVVSYVINGGPRPVAATTRARVEQAVAELGYRPNKAASALARGRSQQVGLVVVDNTSPFYAELTAAIDNELFRRGMTLITVSAVHRPKDAQVTALESLAEHDVSAVIVAADLHQADVAYAQAEGLPLVVLNEMAPSDGVSSAIVDYRTATIEAVRHLVGHGRRRIGFVGHFLHDLRYPAWRDALDGAGLTPGPAIDCDWPIDAGYEAGRRLGAEHRGEVDALFVASDALAMGCIAGLREAGLNVPDDIAIVAFDGTRIAPYIGPGLTTMAQPIERIAADTVDLVLDPESRPGTHLTYSADMVVRHSCGC